MLTNLVAQAGISLFEIHRLGAQHQVRKVDIPLVRRRVRAFRHEAEVAQVAVVDHFPVILLVDPVHLHCRRLVDQVEQRRKRVAQADATAAAVAEVEDPLHLLEQGLLVVEVGVFPVQRMSRGGL